MNKDNLADITPSHEPIGLAREMVKRAPGTIAAIGVLVGVDGTMWRASCGHKSKEVLWALVAEILTLMEDAN